jgi:uncharacterized protein YndB with AHSA1/START domain
MELRFSVYTKIQKPIADVFDAVRNPEKLSKYFATGGASGPIEQGKTVTWRWADFPDASGDVHVKKVVPNQLIVFEWAASEGGYNTTTEMKFEALNKSETIVTITESGWKDDDTGRKSSYGNCMGWSQMLSALKAWLEYGINLRRGAY